jgi:hypothetical protein
MNFRSKIFLLFLIQLILFQSVTLAIADSKACDQTQSTSPNSYLQCLTKESRSIVENEIFRRVKSGQIFTNTGGFDPRYYPTEALLSVVKARNLANKDYYNVWLKKEIDGLANKLKKTNYFLIHPSSGKERVFGENSQSRLVHGLVNIYSIFPNKEIGNLLVSTYAALDSLPLVTVQSSLTGKYFHLPAYLYENPTKPKPISGRTLDPNHEATLADSYLQVSKSGLLSKSESIKALKKSKSYFYAGLDLAIKNRCLALADQPTFIDACDTRYNAFWLHWMLKAQPYLGNSKTLTILRNQYQVMTREVTKFSTKRVYPLPYRGKYPDQVEPMTLLNSVANFGTESQFLSYIDSLNDYLVLNSENSSTWPITFLLP